MKKTDKIRNLISDLGALAGCVDQIGENNYVVMKFIENFSMPFSAPVFSTRATAAARNSENMNAAMQIIAAASKKELEGMREFLDNFYDFLKQNGSNACKNQMSMIQWDHKIK